MVLAGCICSFRMDSHRLLNNACSVIPTMEFVIQVGSLVG